jgi:hypothetical protein
MDHSRAPDFRPPGLCEVFFAPSDSLTKNRAAKSMVKMRGVFCPLRFGENAWCYFCPPLDVSRKSGFYPDIVMAGPDPLRELRKFGAIEPQARFFSRNRGPALLVRKGNPLGIHGLTDIARTGARIALPDAAEEAARARYRAAIDGLIGKSAADAVFAAEVPHFPGRIGIVHRDLPEMVARGYVDAAFTQYHLISYWTRIFPRHFEFVPVSDAEQFFVKIAFGRVIDPLRPRALKAFDEFFFGRARDVYPRYDFARMNDDEYGATLGLD